MRGHYCALTLSESLKYLKSQESVFIPWIFVYKNSLDVEIFMRCVSHPSILRLDNFQNVFCKLNVKTMKGLGEDSGNILIL